MSGRDIPILFSGMMVRALLARRKTQTRRLLYLLRKAKDGRIGDARQLIYFPPPYRAGASGFPRDYGPGEYFDLGPWHKVLPGDRLWVRENIKLVSQGPGNARGIVYEADDPQEVKLFTPENPGKLRVGRLTPSIHMPRWASRLTLCVTKVDVERVQDITDAAAEAEGIVPGPFGYGFEGAPPEYCGRRPREGFKRLWCLLHGEDDGVGCWNANPPVVVISFDVEGGDGHPLPNRLP